MKRVLELIPQGSHTSEEPELQQSKRNKPTNTELCSSEQHITPQFQSDNKKVLHGLPPFFPYLSPFELLNFILTCKDAIEFIKSHPDSMDSWCVRNRNITWDNFVSIPVNPEGGVAWGEGSALVTTTFQTQHRRFALGITLLCNWGILSLQKAKLFALKVPPENEDKWKELIYRPWSSVHLYTKWYSLLSCLIEKDNIDPILLKPFFSFTIFDTSHCTQIISSAIKSPSNAIILKKLCLYVRETYSFSGNFQPKSKRKKLRSILNRFPEKLAFEDFPNLRIVASVIQRELIRKDFKCSKLPTQTERKNWDCSTMLFYRAVADICDTSDGAIPFVLLLELYANYYCCSFYGLEKYFANSKNPEEEAKMLANVIPEELFFREWFWKYSYIPFLEACVVRFESVPNILTRLPTESYFITLPLLSKQWSCPGQRSAFELICEELKQEFRFFERTPFLPLKWLDLMIEYELDHRRILYITDFDFKCGKSSTVLKYVQKPCFGYGLLSRSMEYYNIIQYLNVTKTKGCEVHLDQK